MTFLFILLLASGLFAQGTRKCEIQIQSGQVDATLSNFPVLVTEEMLPSEMIDADGANAAKSDGGDVWFYSDASLTTRLSVDIETFTLDNNPSLSEVDIWVKVPSVSSTVTTSIWVRYKDATATQPARAATYGAEDAYDSNYKLVQHLHEGDNTATDFYKDMTSNINHGTLTDANGNSIQTNGKIGKAFDFNGDADYIDAGSAVSMDFSTSDFSIGGWIAIDIIGNHIVAGRGNPFNTNGSGWFFGYKTGQNLRFNINNGTGTGTIVDKAVADLTDGWHFIYATADRNGNVTIYLDGSSQGTGDISGQDGGDIDGSTMRIGKWGTASLYFDGTVDEVRISSTLRSSGWISTEYNNQNSPSTFAIEQTPGDVSGGGDTTTTIQRIRSIN